MQWISISPLPCFIVTFLIYAGFGLTKLFGWGMAYNVCNVTAIPCTVVDLRWSSADAEGCKYVKKSRLSVYD